MSKATGTIKIEYDLRPCMVRDKPALFHKWVDNRDVLEPSPMRGGHNGGVIAYTQGLVEYADGSVGMVSPTSIKFEDKLFEQYAFEVEGPTSGQK